VGVIASGLAIYFDAGWGWVAPGLLVYGIGVGLATAQLTGVIMVDVPPEKIGQASGSQSTVRQIGSALGIAVLGSALFSATEISLNSRLADVTTLPDEAKAGLVDGVVNSAGGAIPLIQDPAIRDLAGSAFSDGAAAAGFFAAVFLLVGFISTFRLESKHYGR
jgi:hypothetical protein